MNPWDSLMRGRFVSGDWTPETEGETGWNNTTRYFRAEGGRYVARIYETHRDPGKISFEHEALLALAGRGLPFAVPKPVPDAEGRTFALLEDGTGRYGCVFAYIEGARPDSSDPRVAGAVGDAVGRLSAALADTALSGTPAYPPYYEMDEAHPSCTPDKVAGFCEAPPAELLGLSAELRLVKEELDGFRALLPRLRTLPHQLVHGDINDSNLLAELRDPAVVAAVLDFEFCTRDVRAMEPAVVLSGMLEREGAEEAIPSFLRGFAARVRLSGEEAEAVPTLIRLRKLDVFVHFLGRWLDGVDTADTLRRQTAEAASGLAALRAAENDLASWCSLLAPGDI